MIGILFLHGLLFSGSVCFCCFCKHRFKIPTSNCCCERHRIPAAEPPQSRGSGHLQNSGRPSAALCAVCFLSSTVAWGLGGSLAEIPKEDGELLCLKQPVGSMRSPGLVCSLYHSSIGNCSSLQCSYSSPSNHCAPPTAVCGASLTSRVCSDAPGLVCTREEETLFLTPNRRAVGSRLFC